MCLDLTIKPKNGNYCVMQGEQIVYGPTTHDMAQGAVESRKRAARLKERRCMACPDTFLSEGPHNRLCTSCRNRSHYDGSA